MARYNAMEESFEEITVLDKPALFTDIRIERDTVPKGLYLYEGGAMMTGAAIRCRLQRESW